MMMVTMQLVEMKEVMEMKDVMEMNEVMEMKEVLVMKVRVVVVKSSELYQGSFLPQYLVGFPGLSRLHR